MAVGNIELDPYREDAPQKALRLGGFTAMAESAWMGSVQATDVLDSFQTAPSMPARPRVVLPRAPKITVSQLFTREFNIAEASFLLMVSFFLSALLGAVRQILFNAQFGVGNAANAYYAAFRLPDTLFSLIAGGALSSTMIPVLVSTVQHEGKQEGTRLTRLVLTTLMAVFAGITLIGEVFTPAFVRGVLAPGFDGPTTALTVQLTRIMLLQPLMLTVGSVAIAVLNSRNQFFLTAVSVVSHNLALIAGILAARLFPGLGILGPTLGVVAGGLVQTGILLTGLPGSETPLQPVWNPKDIRLREIVRLLVPNGLSVGVNYSGFIVDTAFATKAIEQASLGAIYNAWLLVSLPIALLGQSIGQAAFPRLAAHAADGDWRAMRSTLTRSIGIALALAVPALLALVFLGRLAIRVLFEHGMFNAQAGDVTFDVLTIYALGLPAYVGTELLTRGLIALKDTRTSLITNTLQLILRVGLIAGLISRLDVRAIPTALVISAALETVTLGVVLFLKLRRKMALPRIENRPSIENRSTVNTEN